jgi:hypothetical protein
MQRKVLGLVVLGAVFGLARGYWSIRRALLPSLGGAPTSDEKRAWATYATALQCTVLDPCLKSTGPGGGCAHAQQTLAALSVPTRLQPGPRKNAEFVRAYWLDELGRLENGTFGPFTQHLDTCTPDSLPARLDQHYGLVAPGSPVASCEALTHSVASNADTN